MEYNKKSIIYVVIALIVVVSLMITGSYAYFSINAEGSGNDILVSTFDSNMEITFNDTSNISLVNAYTGESIKKTFNVKNTGDTVVYYDLLFKNLATSLNDLKYFPPFFSTITPTLSRLLSCSGLNVSTYLLTFLSPSIFIL